jgi:2'-5' RNA ligase
MKIQLRITLPPDVRESVDALRLRWNHERARGNPAHLTLVYHDEAPDVALLVERLREVASEVEPFPLTVGPAMRFPEPICGAFLSVADPTDAVTAIRARLLAPPFTQRSHYGLHVTLLHPDQGDRLESAWPEIERLPPVDPFLVTELDMVGPNNETLLSVPLVLNAKQR